MRLASAFAALDLAPAKGVTALEGAWAGPTPDANPINSLAAWLQLPERSASSAVCGPGLTRNAFGLCVPGLSR